MDILFLYILPLSFSLVPVYLYIIKPFVVETKINTHTVNLRVRSRLDGTKFIETEPVQRNPSSIVTNNEIDFTLWKVEKFKQHFNGEEFSVVIDEVLTRSKIKKDDTFKVKHYLIGEDLNNYEAKAKFLLISASVFLIAISSLFHISTN